MTRAVTLCVGREISGDRTNSRIWMAECPPLEISTLCDIRSSPIYRVSEATIEGDHQPLNEHTSHLLLCYTLDAFHALGCLTSALNSDPLLSRVYVTHGFASILVFADGLEECHRVSSILSDCLWGTEIWTLKTGAIHHVAVQAPPLAHESKVDLFLSQHYNEDRAIIGDLQAALISVLRRAAWAAPDYLASLNIIRDVSVEISLDTLYLQDRISEGDYRRHLRAIYSNFASEYFDARARVLNTRKSSPELVCTHLHILRDEAVQCSAVLLNVHSQAFGEMPPLLSSPHQGGTFSLFGVAGVYATLHSLYNHVHRVFTEVSPEYAVENVYPHSPCPPLQVNPQEYESWQREFLRFPSTLDTGSSGPANVKPMYHLLYFSNRLGFRATKYSVSAAWQSILLGRLPSWSLSPLSHEYLHTQVRAILAHILPLEKNTDSPRSFKKAYLLYANRREAPNGPTNLLEFLQAVILQVTADLHACNQNGNLGDNSFRTPDIVEEVPLRDALTRFSHEIDEIVVHVLDYHYFYRCNPEAYVKAIWTSWLKLPFVLTRIHEYAMRTICAISSNKKGNKEKRRVRAVQTLLEQLEELKITGYVQGELIDIVIKTLNEESIKRQIAFEYDALCPLVDTAAMYLVSSRILGLLEKESEDSVQDDDSYRYELQPGTFAEQRIESPVNFLMEDLGSCLNAPTLKTSDDLHFSSLWQFLAISSALWYRESSEEEQP